MARKQLVMRLGAMALVLSLLAGLVALIRPAQAAEYPSLSGIEIIKNTYAGGASFEILEVVPELGRGSIGYYVPGQEPSALSGWHSAIARIAPAAGESHAEAARTEYVEELQKKLLDRSISSAVPAAPEEATALRSVAPLTNVTFVQYDPWDPALPAEGLQRIDLVSEDGEKRTEDVSLSGRVEAVAGGGFTESGAGRLPVAVESPTHVQKPDYFVQGEQAGTVYYYAPVFDMLTVADANNPTEYDGVAIYRSQVGYVDYLTAAPAADAEATAYYAPTFVAFDLAALAAEEVVALYMESTETADTYVYAGSFDKDALESGTATLADGTPFDPDGTYFTLTELGAASQSYTDETPYAAREVSYVYEGTLGVDGYALDADVIRQNLYYAVTSLGAPSAVHSADTHPYAAVGENFAPADLAEGEVPHFMFDALYTYVGEGYGEYKFTADAAEPEKRLRYDHIYATSPYENNDWFRTYVLDEGSAEFAESFPIVVRSVTPAELTQESIEAASLIVLSAGFDLQTGSGMAADYASNDLNGEKAAWLKAAFDDDIPMIVDQRLRDMGEIGALVTELTAKDGAPAAYTFVRENLYAFDPEDDTAGYLVGRYALVSDDFYQPFDDVTEDSPLYGEVLAEIKEENRLRGIAGFTNEDMLPEEVTMANIIRYILNSNYQRVENKKEALSVLEIQPSTGQELDALTVLNWLPAAVRPTFLVDPEQDPETVDNADIKNITIKTMPVQEFIGSMEDITEVYDLVYLGTSLDGFLLDATGEPVYNDPNMNGMVYTNIGDLHRGNVQLLGLLDSDYSPSETFVYNDFDNGFSTINTTMHDLLDRRAEYTYRYSGNDITAKKQAELTDFVNSGFPLILASNLVDEDGALVSGETGTRIDNSSILYETLEDLFAEPNVMVRGLLEDSVTASVQQELMLGFLNLSKPLLELTSKPEAYTNLDTDLLSDNALKFTFTIDNPTDASPTESRYAMHLYLDQNADGRYTDDEELLDLRLVGADGAPVENETLQTGREYSLTRSLPTGFAGAAPWKLDVVKVGANNVRNSVTGLSYAKPEAGQVVELNILQIAPTLSRSANANYGIVSTTGTWDGVEAYTPSGGRMYSLKDDPAVRSLLQELKTAGVYDVKITPITYNDLNEKFATAADNSAYFKDFDMLIIGFGDANGNLDSGGMDFDSSAALLEYIELGRSVLFSHDTTSFRAVPDLAPDRSDDEKPKYPFAGDKTITDNDWHWSYYYNATIRGAVGLDRYGVMDQTFGISSYSPVRDYLTGKDAVSNEPVTDNWTANGYQDDGNNLTETQLQQIESAGYTIAYQPGSDRETLVEQTQGFNDMTLYRYPGYTNQYVTDPDTNLRKLTYDVAQVNSGQLTSYPYNINLAGFGGENETLRVAETHFQYYQLNMNSDDIVVWYTLADPTGDSDPYYSHPARDVVNDYYIYSRGNITYTGFGHSKSEHTTTPPSEAQLLVNTIIASYRASRTEPTITLEDESGAVMSTLLLPTDEVTQADGTVKTEVLISANQTANGRAVPVLLDDPSLDPTKTLFVNLYYEDEAGTVRDPEAAEDADAETVTMFTQWDNTTGVIYLQDELGALVSQAPTLQSDHYYTFYLPAALLEEFSRRDEESMELFFEVVSTVQGDAQTDTAKLTLQKMELKPLA